MRKVYVVESEGFRIGPAWYPEAVFDTPEEAAAWLTTPAAQAIGRTLRVTEDDE